MRSDTRLYKISTAAKMIAVHPRTLRNYEKAGLVKPMRRKKWRYYSDPDIEWLRCLFSIIHDQKINMDSVGKLLGFAPCWEIAGCSRKKRETCSRYRQEPALTSG